VASGARRLDEKSKRAFAIPGGDWTRDRLHLTYPRFFAAFFAGFWHSGQTPESWSEWLSPA